MKTRLRGSQLFLARLRGIRSDERGAANPAATVAAMVVFGLVAAALGGTLVAGMQTMQSSKVNTALQAAVSDLAQRTALRGYASVSTMEAESEVPLKVGGTTVPARLTVLADAETRTAEVTVTAGKYVHGGWHDPASCVDQPTNCTTSNALAVPTLAQTVPTAPGVDLVDAATNLPADNETRFIDYAAGHTVMVAIDEERHLWAWGTSTAGALGAGAGAEELLVPHRIGGDREFVQVSAGDQTAYAIAADGALYAWGANDKGQQGTGRASSEPVRVGTDTWSQIDAESDHVCGITATKALYCWGAAGPHPVAKTAPTRIQLPQDPATSDDETAFGFAAVAVGPDHYAAIDQYGDVWTWGSNAKGQLGVGSAPTTTTTLQKVTAANAPISQAPIERVSVGASNTYAIDVFGRMWAWGDGTGYKVGDGKTTTRNTPVRIGGDKLFATVRGGVREAFATTEDGALYAWGDGGDKLGIPDPEDPTMTAFLQAVPEPAPVGVPDGSDRARFLDVDLPLHSGGYAAALDSTHRLWIWGTDAPVGVFGNAVEERQTRPAPTEQSQLRYLSSGSAIHEVGAGAAHGVSLDASGDVWTWGSNSAGQIGSGEQGAHLTAPPTKVPETKVPALPAQVAIGQDRTFVLNTDGSTAGAGRMLGNATIDAIPAAAPIDKPLLQVFTDELVSAGIAEDGLYMWGDNSGSALGQGNKNAYSGAVRVSVPGSPRIVDVALDAHAVLALDANGDVWEWGTAGWGVPPKTYGTPKPVTFPADAGRIVDVDLSANRAIAVDENGALWTWGDPYSSALGDSACECTFYTGPILEPVAVEIQPDRFVAVATNDYASFALTGDGDVYSWGAPEWVGLPHKYDPGMAGIAIDYREPTKIATISKPAVQIVAAENHALALDADGDIWGWGWSAGTTAGVTPVYAGAGNGTRIPSLITSTPADDTPDFVSIAAGRSSSAAIGADGSVWMTGGETAGHLGNGTAGTLTTWTRVGQWSSYSRDNDVAFLEGETTAVAAGGDVTAAVNGGRVWAWGGPWGAKPRPVGMPSSMHDVSVSDDGRFIVASDMDAVVWTVGTNGITGTNPPLQTAQRLPVPAAAPIADVDAGSGSLAVVARVNGEVIRWGAGQAGGTDCADRWPGFPCSSTATLTKAAVIGDAAVGVDRNGDTVLLSTEASPPAMLTGRGVNDLSGYGEQHVYALKGGLLAGEMDAHAHPVELPDMSVSLIQVEAGSGFAVGVDDRGFIWTWGRNESRQLGRNGAAADYTPGRLEGGPQAGWLLDAVGYPHTLDTTWTLATMNDDVDDLLQVNMSTPIPLATAQVTCGEESLEQEQFDPSSGVYRHSNLDTSEIACGDAPPTLSVLMHGWPARADGVDTIIVPLVETDKREVPTP